MKVLVTSAQNKEEKAIEEVISLIFQKDPNARPLEKTIKPGLSLIEASISKEELAYILKNSNRTYFIKVIPVDIETENYEESIKEWISLNWIKIKDKSFAVRCYSRFGKSGSLMEKEIGKILKEKGIKINLKSPDFIILVQPVYSKFLISFLSFKDYLIFLSRKKI
ncbi:MAG: THUMP domain-containing protein [Thermoproteota archaeon]